MRQKCMRKTDALKLFGGTVGLQKALELGTHSAISAWPEELTTAQADRVRGAAMRLSKKVPPHMREARLQRGAKRKQQVPA